MLTGGTDLHRKSRIAPKSENDWGELDRLGPRSDDNQRFELIQQLRNRRERIDIVDFDEIAHGA